MQDFFERAKDAVTETTKTAIKKSGDLVEAAKLKFSIVDNEGKLKTIFTEIGSYVYNKDKDGGEITKDDFLTERCTAVSETLSVIADLELRLASAMNKKICGNCGKSNNSESHFCYNCGSKF